jgi:hypothetical protein
MLLPGPSAHGVRAWIRLDVMREDGDLGDTDVVNIAVWQRKWTTVGGPLSSNCLDQV